jgi:hypothetical protein
MSGTLSEIVDLATDPADGLVEQIEAAGIVVRRVGGTKWYVSDVAAARAIATGYNPLPAQKRERLARLDAEADARLSLTAIMRAGSATNVTAAQMSTYLAAATNRYRTLRAAVQGAADTTALRAIDFTTGWPANL